MQMILLVDLLLTMNNLLIKLAELPADLPQVFEIRTLVFQMEQGVGAELEFDGKDEQSQHLLAYLDGNPVGTARIRLLDSKTAKVERVAVLSEVRGLGIGKKIMEKALETLASANIAEVQIHAQEPVKDFYIRLGFVPEGEVFEEAGIPHVKMKKLLK